MAGSSGMLGDEFAGEARKLGSDAEGRKRSSQKRYQHNTPEAVLLGGGRRAGSSLRLKRSRERREHSRIRARSVPLERIALHSGSSGDEPGHDLVIATGGGSVGCGYSAPPGQRPDQRRSVPGLVDDVDASATSKQRLHHIDMSVIGGNMQPRVPFTMRVEFCIDVDTSVEQELDDVGVAVSAGEGKAIEQFCAGCRLATIRAEKDPDDIEPS